MSPLSVMSGKRWWWWVALVSTSFVVMGIPASFYWSACWITPSWGYGVTIQYGCLCIMSITWETPDVLLPWYGFLLFSNITHPIFPDWLPNLYYENIQRLTFTLPLHVLLIVLLPIVFYPMLPIVNKRRRRKRGLCVKCGYNLLGNESRTCPECGTEIKA